MKIATLIISLLLVATLMLAACTPAAVVEDSNTPTDTGNVISEENSLVNDIIIPEDDEVEIGELI